MILALKILAADQRELQARKQAVTQQLRITRKKGADLVVQIRSAIRSRLGHRSEGLVPLSHPAHPPPHAQGGRGGRHRRLPRPDLLAAIGLAPAPSPATSAPEPAALTGGTPSSEES